MTENDLVSSKHFRLKIHQSAETKGKSDTERKGLMREPQKMLKILVKKRN